MHARRCPFSRDRSLYYGNSPARLVARPLRLRLKLCRDFGLPVSGAGGIESRWRRRWRGGRRGSGHLSRRKWWLRRRSPREGGGQQDSATGGRRCPITRFPTTGGTTGDPYITACMHCALSSSSPPVKRRQCYDRARNADPVRYVRRRSGWLRFISTSAPCRAQHGRDLSNTNGMTQLQLNARAVSSVRCAMRPRAPWSIHDNI
jgi:hypothetical protein